MHLFYCVPNLTNGYTRTLISGLKAWPTKVSSRNLSDNGSEKGQGDKDTKLSKKELEDQARAFKHNRDEVELDKFIRKFSKNPELSPLRFEEKSADEILSEAVQKAREKQFWDLEDHSAEFGQVNDSDAEDQFVEREDGDEDMHEAGDSDDQLDREEENDELGESLEDMHEEDPKAWFRELRDERFNEEEDNVLRCPGHKQGKGTKASTCPKFDLRDLHVTNTPLLSKFTCGGVILGKRKTGLCARCQRRVAKTIKASRCLGFFPFVTEVGLTETDPKSKFYKYKGSHAISKTL